MGIIGTLSICLSMTIMGCYSQSTWPMTTLPPGNPWGGGGGHSSGNCEGSFPGTLSQSPRTTFQHKPKPAISNATYFLWKSYGKSRPQIVLTICEFTIISGITFSSTNVKSSGIFVDGDSFYGAVDQYGKVEVTTESGSMSSSKVGWVVKINLTPKDYSKPLEVRNLEIRTCSLYYDCFDDCALYLLDSTTGCKKPRCRGDPCNDLDCSDSQECRLIENEPIETFPSVMTSGVQLWGCVDKDRTDYGCVCKKYKVGENQCPKCDCK